MKTVDQLKLVYAKSPTVVKRWMGVNILSAFALAVSEYVTAISIQMLLVGLGLLAATSLPKFFHDVPMGLGLALSALVLTAFLRATFQTLNYQSSYEVRETFVKHLRTLFLKIFSIRRTVDQNLCSLFSTTLAKFSRRLRTGFSFGSRCLWRLCKQRALRSF